jgi:hypothetical protein
MITLNSLKIYLTLSVKVFPLVPPSEPVFAALNVGLEASFLST